MNLGKGVLYKAHKRVRLQKILDQIRREGQPVCTSQVVNFVQVEADVAPAPEEEPLMINWASTNAGGPDPISMAVFPSCDRHLFQDQSGNRI